MRGKKQGLHRGKWREYLDLCVFGMRKLLRCVVPGAYLVVAYLVVSVLNRLFAQHFAFYLITIRTAYNSVNFSKHCARKLVEACLGVLGIGSSTIKIKTRFTTGNCCWSF